jgi:CAP12/Pycsar effector protein, TIR domain
MGRYDVEIADELSKAAEDAARALAEVRDVLLQKPLAAVRKSVENAKRAWSGSNIGYHADVYFADLQPAPPNAQFSSEWGLMDRWPTHQPHPGWRIMDRQVVIDAILKRANVADTDALEHALGLLGKDFDQLKERAISLLTEAIADAPDKFLDRKLTQIEQLARPDRSRIENDLVPGGNYWTRDSLALSQGLRSAPHQSLEALCLSATALERGLDSIEKAAGEAGSHIQRVNPPEKVVKPTREAASRLRRIVREKKSTMVGTNIFIGHGRAPAWRELKEFVKDRLGLSVDEFNSVPVAGMTTLDRLSRMLDAAAFAFLVLTAEDEQPDGKIRAPRKRRT